MYWVLMNVKNTNVAQPTPAFLTLRTWLWRATPPTAGRWSTGTVRQRRR